MFKIYRFLLIQLLFLVSTANSIPDILKHRTVLNGPLFLQLNAKYSKLVDSDMESNAISKADAGINFNYAADLKLLGGQSWQPSVTIGYYWNENISIWGMFEIGSYKYGNSDEWIVSADSSVNLLAYSYYAGYRLEISDIDFMGYFLGIQYCFLPRNEYVLPYFKTGIGINQFSYTYNLFYGEFGSYNTIHDYLNYNTISVSVDANEFLLGGYFGLGTDILIYKFLKLNLEANYNISQKANSKPEDNYTLVSKNDPKVYKFNDGTFSLNNYAIKMGLMFLMF